MAQTFNFVQGDTGPDVRVVLTEQDGSAVDLAGATVTLHFKAPAESTALFSRNFIITDAANGVAVLRFQSGDLDVAAGVYEGEIEVVRASGARETLFSVLRFKVRADFA